jgi:hypothetical protein
MKKGKKKRVEKFLGKGRKERERIISKWKFKG